MGPHHPTMGEQAFDQHRAGINEAAASTFVAVSRVRCSGGIRAPRAEFGRRTAVFLGKRR